MTHIVQRSHFKCLILGAFVALLCLSTDVYAFSGLRSKRMFKLEAVRGVDAFGFYFGGDGQLDIRFQPCDDSNASRDIYGVCQCNDPSYHFEPVESEDGEIEQVCIFNDCYGRDLHSGCIECTSSQGQAHFVYPELCGGGKYVCTDDGNHDCVNPCDTIDFDSECQKCEPNGKQTRAENVTGTCTNRDDASDGKSWICDNGSCKNPCQDAPEEDQCISYWYASNGQCFPHYAVGDRCDDNDDKICNGEGACVYKACSNNKHVRDGEGNCVCPQEVEGEPDCSAHNQTFDGENCECICDASYYIEETAKEERFTYDFCTHDAVTLYKKVGCAFGYSPDQVPFTDSTDCIYNCTNFDNWGDLNPECAECIIDSDGSAMAQPKTGTCKLDSDAAGTKNGICSEGQCINPCEDKTDTACEIWNAVSGECVPTRPGKEKSCSESDPHRVCDGSSHCVCDSPDYYEDEDDGICYINACKDFNPEANICFDTCVNDKGQAQYHDSYKNSCDGDDRYTCYSDGLCGCTARKFRTTTGSCELCSASDEEAPPEVDDIRHCEMCKNFGQPRFLALNKFCVSCEDSSYWSTTKGQCEQCNNRFIDEDGYCYLCSIQVSARTSTKDDCHRCPTRVFNSATGSCELCQEGEIIEEDDDGNRTCQQNACATFIESECESDCSTREGVATYTVPEGTKCGDKNHRSCYKNEEGRGICRCDSGYYLDTEDNKCYVDACQKTYKDSICHEYCENYKGVAVYNYPGEIQCDRDEEGAVIDEHMVCQDKGICDCVLGYQKEAGEGKRCEEIQCNLDDPCVQSCNPPKLQPIGYTCGSQSFCNNEGLCVCESENKFKASNGQCYSCADSNSHVVTDSKYCNECFNKSDNPRFTGYDGRCYSCSTGTSVEADQTQCDLCSGIRTYNSDTNKCELCPSGSEIIDGECVPDLCKDFIQTDCKKCETKKNAESGTYYQDITYVTAGTHCGGTNSDKVCTGNQSEDEEEWGLCKCPDETREEGDGRCYEDKCAYWKESPEDYPCIITCSSSKGVATITYEPAENEKNCDKTDDNVTGKICQANGKCDCEPGAVAQDDVDDPDKKKCILPECERQIRANSCIVSCEQNEDDEGGISYDRDFKEKNTPCTTKGKGSWKCHEISSSMTLCACNEHGKFRTADDECLSCDTADVPRIPIPDLEWGKEHCHICQKEGAAARFVGGDGHFCFPCSYPDAVPSEEDECISACTVKGVQLRYYDNENGLCRPIEDLCRNYDCPACERCDYATGEARCVLAIENPATTGEACYTEPDGTKTGACTYKGCCNRHITDSEGNYLCNATGCSFLYNEDHTKKIAVWEDHPDPEKKLAGYGTCKPIPED